MIKLTKGRKRAIYAAAVSVSAGLYAWSDLYLGTYAGRAFQMFALVILLSVNFILVVVGVTTFFGQTRATTMVQGVAAVIVGFVGLIVVSLLLVTYPYTVKHDRAGAIEVVAEAHPTYHERLNFPQAKASLERSLQGVVGDMSDPTYVPYIAEVIDDDGDTTTTVTGQWCAYITQRGNLGREWITRVNCLMEDGDVIRKAFDKKLPSPDGYFDSSLARQISHIDRGTVADAEDVYAYIDADGEPHLVAPLQMANKTLGLRFYDVSAGVVVFDRSGNTTHVKNPTAGEVLGPVVPLSLATEMRESLNAAGSYWTYRKPKNNPDALQDTSHIGEDVGADVNDDNVSEFTLMREDGRLVYVTPLTAYGSSRNVVAYVEVAADEANYGELPATNVYRLGAAEAATQTIAQRITSLYDADIEWSTTNDGTDSNTARIFEITPTEAGSMVATIGTGDQSRYLVTIESALTEQDRFGEVCVYRHSSRELIRCDDSEGDPAPVGALRGLVGSGSSSDSSKRSEAPTDLQGYTLDELLAEIERRVGE